MLSVRHIAALAEDYGLLATDLGGCVLWLSDDSRLIALSQPAVTFPKDFSQSGTWARTGLTSVTHGAADPDGGTSADTIVEDTSNGLHYLRESVGATYIGNLTTRAELDVKYVDCPWIWMQSYSGHYVFFNVQTGVIGTQNVATGTITPLPGGWYRCTMDFTSTAGASNCDVGMVGGDNVTSYIGTSRSARVYNYRLTQNRVAQWSDRTVNANHFTQATAANQPQWQPTSGPLGRPTIISDGVDDHMSNAVENTVSAYTIFAVVRIGDISAQRAIWSNRHLVAPGGGTVVFLGTQAATGKIFCFMNTASIPSLLTSNALANNEWGIVELAVDGTGRSLGLNGTLTNDAANTTTTKIPSGYLWRDSGVYSAGRWGDLAMWTRRLSLDERSRVRQCLGALYGIAVTP
jgi:hypothetical protein